MKINLLLIFVSLLFFKCTTKTTTSDNAQPLPTIVTAEDFSKRLDSLPSTMKSSLDGLEMFKTSFAKENLEENDKAFRFYLEFQNKLIGTLEQELFNDTDFYNRLSITYADSPNNDKQVVAYIEEVKKNGLRFSEAEGSLFLDSNPEKFSEYFGAHLTDGSKEFLQQYMKELNNAYSEDAALIIPVADLGQRLIFWDKFLSKYPDHVFGDRAEDFFKTYLRTMLIGLDNTLAYDQDTREWSKDYRDVYLSIVEKEPATTSGEILFRFLKLLDANEYKYSEKVQAFVDENASFD
jgi:hypothetical protein